MDATYDKEMRKLCNWLLHGLSTTDINGAIHSNVYDDSFFVISKDGF